MKKKVTPRNFKNPLTRILSKLWENDFDEFQFSFNREQSWMDLNPPNMDWDMDIYWTNSKDYGQPFNGMKEFQKGMDQKTVFQWMKNNILPRTTGDAKCSSNMGFTEKECEAFVNKLREAGWTIEENTIWKKKNHDHYIHCRIKTTWEELENKIPNLK